MSLEKGVIDNEIEIYSLAEIENVHDEYDYIVLDIGSDIKNREVKRANIKVMMCLFDEDKIKKLADFMQNECKPEKWFYIFNLVPANKQREVWNLMEDYDCCCLPIYDNKNIDKTIKKIVRNILKGG